MQYNPAMSLDAAIVLASVLAVCGAAILACRWVNWYRARRAENLAIFRDLTKPSEHLKEQALKFHQTNQNQGDVLNFLELKQAQERREWDVLVAKAVSSAVDAAEVMADQLPQADQRRYWEQLLQHVQEKVNNLPG